MKRRKRTNYKLDNKMLPDTVEALGNGGWCFEENIGEF